MLELLNTNKFFVGLSLILMNIGSRYVIGDLNHIHEKLLASSAAKTVILFCMFFVGTRDVMVAACMTFAFFVVVHGFLNYKSKMSIIPEKFTQVSNIEYQKAQDVVKRYEQEHGKTTPIPQTGAPHETNSSWHDYHNTMHYLAKMKHAYAM